MKRAIAEGIEKVYIPKINSIDVGKDMLERIEIVYVNSIFEILDPESPHYPFEVNKLDDEV